MANEVNCRHMAARRMCGFSDNNPKQFYFLSSEENVPDKSIKGPSLWDKNPKMSNYWTKVSDDTYSLSGNQNKPQRLIFNTGENSIPVQAGQKIYFCFCLSDVKKGSVAPMIIGHEVYGTFSAPGNYIVISEEIISPITAVGIEADTNFSGTVQIKSIYPTIEANDK